ncbi:MAG: flagellar brake protein [Bacillota bacterium]|nr:flagellar brake protein [Bacillota bacterium]
MDILQHIKAGEVVDVQTSTEKYQSKIYDLEKPDVLLIAPPLKKQIYGFIEQGAKLDIIFYRDNGLFTFQAVVQKKVFSNNVLCLRVKALTEPERYQRRDYYRLPICIKTKVFYQMDAPDETGTIHQRILNVFTVNLSGGGLCIKTEEEIPLRTLVTSVFSLNRHKSITLNGTVVWIKEINDQVKSYHIGIEFEKYDESLRQDIIRFIYAQQRRIANIK